MRQTMTQDDLSRMALAYQGTGAVSAENRGFGFRPGFFDRDSGRFLLARDADGLPASVHRFDGLPDEWVVDRDGAGSPLAVKPSVVPGFIRDGAFFTREQAAQLVQWELDKLAS